MSSGRDLFIDAEEELIELYMDNNPEATEEEARAAVHADPYAISNHVTDNLVDQADFAREQRDALM